MIRRAVLAALLLLGFITAAGAQSTNSPLRLEKTISMPGVQGRIDHMFFDAPNRQLFVAALGYNTVEIINVKQGKRVRTISGLHEPQGILYLSGRNRIYLANSDNGTLRMFDGTSYQRLGITKLGDDADNIRWDPQEHRVYVGYGSGALAVLDEKGAKLGNPLDAHPESFRLESHGPRIFVNVPDSRRIAVVDKKTKAVITTWTTDDALQNFPMALDEANRRLFVVCRRPARLLTLNIDTGKVTGTLPVVGDCDDVFYDAAVRRIYVTWSRGEDFGFPATNCG